MAAVGDYNVDRVDDVLWRAGTTVSAWFGEPDEDYHDMAQTDALADVPTDWLAAAGGSSSPDVPSVRSRGAGLAGDGGKFSRTALTAGAPGVVVFDFDLALWNGLSRIATDRCADAALVAGRREHQPG